MFRISYSLFVITVKTSLSNNINLFQIFFLQGKPEEGLASLADSEELVDTLELDSLGWVEV